MTMLMGILLQCILIQIVFIFGLLFGYTAPILFILVPLNTIIVFSHLFVYSNGSNLRALSQSLSFDYDRRVLKIIVIAIAIRVLLLVLAQSCIAPDASLYADFARGIVEGQFNTSVIGDERVYDLWNGYQYCFHQGFTYLFALSWLLLPPAISGPTLILTVVGVSLVLLSYSLTNRFFGTTAAIWVSGILAVHPLFVFHSAVAYGPEITSLLFLVGAFLLFHNGSSNSKSSIIIAGLFVALADIIWYPNFLLFCVAFPVFIISGKTLTARESISLAFGMGLVLASRIFYLNLVLYALCWAVLFGVLGASQILRPHEGTSKQIPFFAAIASLMLLWRWPVQLAGVVSSFAVSSASTGGATLLLQAPNPDLSIFFQSIRIEVIIGMFIFTLFHVTPILFFLLPVALLKGTPRLHVISLALFALVGLGGTLFLFSSFASQKDTLLVAYIYSDSRFFLSISLMVIIALGSVFSWFGPYERTHETTGWGRIRRKLSKRPLTVALLIMIGFSPGYLAIPSGLALVNMTERYGWDGLADAVAGLEDADSVFMVDRTTEFVWLTNRHAASFWFLEEGMPLADALRRLMSESLAYNASYFIMDYFTYARWRTLYSLLSVSVIKGHPLLLDTSRIESLDNRDVVGPVSALSLAAETEHDLDEPFARVYRLGIANFSRLWFESKFEDGWSVDNGHLLHQNDSTKLVIAEESAEVVLRRTIALDLGIGLQGGFFLCKIRTESANVSHVEILDDQGRVIALAEPYRNDYYFALLGDLDVGEIRIGCVGSPGHSVSLEYLSLWGTS